MTKRSCTPAFMLCLGLASAATTPAHAYATETRRLVGVVTDVIYEDSDGDHRRVVTLEYDTSEGTRSFQFTRTVRCSGATGSYFPGEFVEIEVNDAAQLVWLDYQSWGPGHARSY